MKENHKQVPLKVNKKNIKVDIKIKNLIKELNKSGIKTSYSCQGDERNDSYFSFHTKNISNISIGDKYGDIHWKRNNIKPTKKTKVNVIQDLTTGEYMFMFEGFTNSTFNICMPKKKITPFLSCLKKVIDYFEKEE